MAIIDAMWTKGPSLPTGKRLPRARIRPHSLAAKTRVRMYSLWTVGERRIVFISGMPLPAAAGEMALVRTTERMTKITGNVVQIK